MNESVESDALVIPSSSGCAAVAGRPPCPITRSFSSRNRNLSTCSSIRNRVAHILDLHPRIICRAMTSMCLSLMLTPCSR